MAKMPPRRILRSIVMDAISDREAFDDPSIEEETRKTIEAHRSLLLRLADDQPAMDGDTKDALALACLHARIWRESYVDSWIHTGEGDIILKARQDVERVDRTEKALGFRYRSMADVIESREKYLTLDQIRCGSCA
ncbi:hypothetical protein [uncultured Salinicola sp.]|uniref:hypothetical protein n=1 Tax=uncultured Salinicola sp. TaxID=1193542 RepID=UPI00260F5B78|nr:hypothetical protein [uncultured Salinicola sp.]|tara:strand:- start:345 stop:752 length:408 start_codon:yes stop_codon:yes gene_type:complete